MSKLDIYELNIDKIHMNSIKKTMNAFKVANPNQQGTSCIYSMQSSSSTYEFDIDQCIMDKIIYDEESQDAVKNVLKIILKTILVNYKSSEFIFESWINMIYNGRDDLYDNKFHDHHSMNMVNKRLIPDKSLVFYIQMPNNLQNNDGVLFYKDEDVVKHVLPREGQLIVMNSKVSHVPNLACHSTQDRIVMGVNIKLL